ncbi:MAG: ferritin, partial [Candidatus Latescibacteria bacterium]|nr:ferritin [Candidatus Latescibacterota bacterium]
QINALVDLALKENDHTTHSFLQWYDNEQLEEVSSMETLLKIIRRSGANIMFLEYYLARKGSALPAAE